MNLIPAPIFLNQDQKRELAIVIEQVKEPNTSENQIIEIFQELGKTTIVNSAFYYSFVSHCITLYPPYGQLVAEAKSYKPADWVLEEICSYGLTYKGIRALLAIKGIQAQVVETLDELKEIYSSLKDGHKISIITDGALLVGNEKVQHAVAVFLERQKETMKMMILDSLAIRYDKGSIAALLPKNLNLILRVSAVARQVRNSFTCYAYAIHDCKAFQDHPLLMEKISELNPRPGRIEHLPDELMNASSSKEKRREALEYQAMLLCSTRV